MHDGEVDLGLVEPAGVDGGVDEDQVLVSAFQASDRGLAAVRGAVVDDHEHALRLAVGLDAHELLDERIERLYSVGGSAAIEQLRAPGVPGGEVATRAPAFVLVLDALAALDGDGGGQRRVLARSGLDRGLLIAAHDVVAEMQKLAFPATAVEVEDATGLP